MDMMECVLAKQRDWAERNGMEVSSRDGEAEGLYVADLDDNLFVPMSSETRDCFLQGDGGELGDSSNRGKMQALHSSSALGVNVFEYWKQREDSLPIAAACGLCRSDSTHMGQILFEEKFPINDNFGLAPNLDVTISWDDASTIKRLAIECKFTEAYGSYRHGGLKARYLSECQDLWQDIPNLRNFAETISPDDSDFVYLHPAQLVKHILGLKRQFGKRGFRLLYLWYDAFGEAGTRHHEEVERFKKVARDDGVLFYEMTYQELLVRMSRSLIPKHSAYVSWLIDRYL